MGGRARRRWVQFAGNAQKSKAPTGPFASNIKAGGLSLHLLHLASGTSSEHFEGGPRRAWVAMFFTFPKDAHLNTERQAVEFGVEIGEYSGVVRVPRRVFQRLLSERPTPERCVEGYYLQRTRFERIAERKLRQRQLTEDGNVEIIGRALSPGWGPCRHAGECLNSTLSG